MKICADCKFSKEEIKFYKNKQNKDGLYSYCIECSRLRMKKWAKVNNAHKTTYHRVWRQKNPEKVKAINARQIKRKKLKTFKIDDEQYNNMICIQNNLCAICSKESKQRALAIDHCHKTKKIRGLLCSKCNRGLGFFNDDSNLLTKAIEYLSK